MKKKEQYKKENILRRKEKRYAILNGYSLYYDFITVIIFILLYTLLSQHSFKRELGMI